MWNRTYTFNDELGGDIPGRPMTPQFFDLQVARGSSVADHLNDSTMVDLWHSGEVFHHTGRRGIFRYDSV